MPIIKVTPVQLKNGQPVPEKWYPATVKSITAKASKDQQSVNYETICNIDDKSPEGRDIKDQFNSKLMLGWGSFVGSIQGKPVDSEKALEIDSDTLIGGKLKLKVKNDIYNGMTIPKFGAFLPFNTDTDSLPF